MHKTWPSPKFPDCVCDLGRCSAPRLGSASISLAPGCGEVSMGIRRGAGRREESQGEVFVPCFGVCRVGHRFAEGVCRVRSSKAWVFPGGSRAEPLSGCRAVSSGAGGDQPELEEMLGRDEVHPSVGFPCVPLGCPPKIPSGDQVCA